MSAAVMSLVLLDPRQAAEFLAPLGDRLVDFGGRPFFDRRMRELAGRTHEDERIHEGVIDGALQVVLFPQALQRAQAPLLAVAP